MFSSYEVPRWLEPEIDEVGASYFVPGIACPKRGSLLLVTT